MRRTAAVVIIGALVAACVSPAPSTSPPTSLPTIVPSHGQTVLPSAQSRAPTPSQTLAPASTDDPRIVGWRADIGQLVEGLESRHPDLEQQVALADLEQAAGDLSARVPTLGDDELLVGIMGIVALVSRKGCDAHTGAYVWGGGEYPVDSLPLRLWLFGDDVYVVDALPPYEELIGQRVLQIAGRPTEDVVSLIEPIVPRDNDETVRLLMPRFLLIPQVLRGLGVPVGMTVVLQSQDVDRAIAETGVAPIPMADYNDWAGPYGLHLPADPSVPYLSRIDDILWWQRLPDRALYVQYNRVDATPLSDLQATLDDPDVKQVVLDLRHNYGGELSVSMQFAALFTSWLAADPHHALEVATARNTFSAGSLITAWLDQADATIAGEPMGGCPSGWGNSRDFTLKYSGIPISVSTTFNTGATADDPRQTITPDLPRELSVDDWRAKRDPVLEAHQLQAQ